MKINGINRPQVDAATTTKPVAKRGTTEHTTRVAVSNEAKQLAEARSPEVTDAEKIARLAQAIARGEFKVEAQQLAERMLREES